MWYFRGVEMPLTTYTQSGDGWDRAHLPQILSRVKTQNERGKRKQGTVRAWLQPPPSPARLPMITSIVSSLGDLTGDDGGRNQALPPVSPNSQGNIILIKNNFY